MRSGYMMRKEQQAKARGNSKEAIAWRLRDNAARKLAGEETDAKYPPHLLTPENVMEARAYFEIRRSVHMSNSETP